MKVTVSWEDGDRTSRVMVLATEIRDCIELVCAEE